MAFSKIDACFVTFTAAFTCPVCDDEATVEFDRWDLSIVTTGRGFAEMIEAELEIRCPGCSAYIEIPIR